MRSAAVVVVLAWLRAECVRALLWGVWRFVLARSGEAQDRAFGRFCALVDAADCSPCVVEFVHPCHLERRAAEGGCIGPSLWIGTAPIEEDC